jgi:hypothetical protein
MLLVASYCKTIFIKWYSVCSLYINIWRTLEKERNIIFHYIIAKGRSRNLEYCFLLITFYLPKSKTTRAWIVLYSASTTEMSMTKMYTKKNIWINWCLCAICLAFRYLNILFYRKKNEYYYERTKMHFFCIENCFKNLFSYMNHKFIHLKTTNIMGAYWISPLLF